VSPSIGGVLVQGPSGTAKSTAVRGLAALLGEIEVVPGCPFSCAPSAPAGECAVCAGGGELPVARRPRRIVDLPLNATEDRVAGSVDVARALREGTMALEPGLLAAANRGILYVDEINLLDDHLADVLLDAAAMGVNTVEREGVSIAHPARFMLVGTMNPEEGDLRPQLADRIGLHVEVDGIEDSSVRAEVLRRREAWNADPEAFAATWDEQQQALRARLARAVELLPGVVVRRELYGAIARLVVRMGVSSHRADITILECAKATAALGGRGEVEEGDVFEAAALALGHRIAFDPFEPSEGLDERQLRRVLEDVLDAEKKAPPTTAAAASTPTSPSWKEPPTST